MGSLRNMVLAHYPVKMYSLRLGSIMYKELQSYAVGLDILPEIADELIRECFVSTAEDYGLSLYEKLYGSERTDLTTEQRRSMLLNLMSLNENDNSIDGIIKFLKSVGVEDCEIVENPTICDLYILAKGREYSETEMDFITERAEEFLPCHLNFTIDFRTICWQDLDSYDKTFYEIDHLDMTWKQFERFNGED